VNRWTTKYLALAALPFVVACDDSPMSDVAEVHAQSMSSQAASDVLVVVFETRQPAAVAADVAVTEVGPSATDAIEPADVVVDANVTGVAPTGRWMVESGRLVLAYEDIATDWSTGPAKLVQGGDPKKDGLFVAQKTLLASALPAAMTQVAGTEVKVYDDTREVCVARVGTSGGFELNAKLVHLPDSWGDDEQAIAPSHTADEVFEKGLTLVSAGLEPLMGDCTKGLWATPVGAHSPVLFRKAAIAPALARKAIAAFRSLPAWHTAQNAMLTFWQDDSMAGAMKGKRWDMLDGTKPLATLYRSHDGARTLVVVSANSHEGCGSEGQQLTSLLELLGEGKDARFVEVGSMAWADAPRGIVDIGADGTLELLVGSDEGKRPMNLRIERWHNGRPTASEDNGWRDEQRESLDALEIPDITYWGCGC